MNFVRIASVPYVNAEPLTWGFTAGPYRTLFEVVKAPPSAIPGLLTSGQVDAGLIPSIEYLRLADAEALPYLCIAAKRRARSVLLLSKGPVDEIRSVALDSSSRTSAALLKILLHQRGLRDVLYAEQAPSPRAMLRDHDAALIIGDPALTADTEGLVVTDLGAEWADRTGLPFVFAIWAARRDADLPDGVRPFLESRQMGVANIPRIARDAAVRLRLPADRIESYLRTHIHYHLGSEEARGLELFLRLAQESGIVTGHRRVAFREPPAGPHVAAAAPPPARIAHE